MNWKGWVTILAVLVVAGVALHLYLRDDWDQRDAELAKDIETEKEKVEAVETENVALRGTVATLQEQKKEMKAQLASARKRARRQLPPPAQDVPGLQSALDECHQDRKQLDVALTLEEMTTQTLNQMVQNQGSQLDYKDNVIDIQDRRISGWKREAKKQKAIKIVSGIAIGLGSYGLGLGTAAIVNAVQP